MLYNSEQISIGTGTTKVFDNNCMICSSPLGSCIAIVAFNPEKKVGGIAHIMLPGRAPEKETKKTKYAVDAIDKLLNLMNRYGIEKKDLEIYVVGASNVLKKNNDTICESNANSVLNYLNSQNITPKAIKVGGYKRRSVYLDLNIGKVCHSIGNSKKYQLNHD